ncbi:hypothetical protein [Gracilimonas sp.]|uniref:hypothetical protein n=1 Tax=Gracilimonas sp. TaxID=1974203 RepID=UPI002871FC98|nr:6-bladed beta-propeller [Gracilimonas sp.]
MNLSHIKCSALLLFAVIGFLISSCGNNSSQNSAPDIDDILSFEAQLIHSFDHTGDRYFDHLGYDSVVLENGNIAFADRELSNIFIVNSEGELQKVIEKGRGPGEVLDAYSFTKTKEGHVFTYDQFNDKILHFDSNFDLLEEWIPQKNNNFSVTKIFSLENEQYVFEMSSYDFLRDENKEREKIFSKYYPDQEEYGESWVLKAKPFALMIIDGGNVGGAGPIPFSFDLLTAYNAEGQTIFIFDTRSSIVAEVISSFDTLSTTQINLPTERVSSAELDSLQDDFGENDVTNGDFWNRVEDQIPEIKSPASKMIYHKENFWLKSNLSGSYEKWFVVNMNGEISHVVNLPKESMLMHVSDYHLGVRLDDVTFALFTNPKPEGL